jgi:hypothetical protein
VVPESTAAKAWLDAGISRLGRQNGSAAMHQRFGNYLLAASQKKVLRKCRWMYADARKQK